MGRKSKSGLARRNGTKEPGPEMRLLLVVLKASNRNAPRGARAQKRTNLASDARQHGEQAKVQRVIRLSQQCHPQKPFSFYAGTGHLI
jgi:hypothetical protein